jgi:hypothetical protein
VELNECRSWADRSLSFSISSFLKILKKLIERVSECLIFMDWEQNFWRRLLNDMRPIAFALLNQFDREGYRVLVRSDSHFIALLRLVSKWASLKGKWQDLKGNDRNSGKLTSLRRIYRRGAHELNLDGFTGFNQQGWSNSFHIPSTRTRDIMVSKIWKVAKWRNSSYIFILSFFHFIFIIFISDHRRSSPISSRLDMMCFYRDTLTNKQCQILVVI